VTKLMPSVGCIKEATGITEVNSYTSDYHVIELNNCRTLRTIQKRERNTGVIISDLYSLLWISAI